MKQKYILAFSLLLSFGLFGSCYKDKGNYDYRENIGEAVIESIPGVTDNENSFVCLENELVKLNPVIKFAEGTEVGDYEFEWKRYYKTPKGGYGHFVQPEVISTSMNLEYRIQETPENYWAVFKVTNKQTRAVSELKFSFVISPLNGWMVLDEDGNGNGDISFIQDGDIVPGGKGDVIRNHFSSANEGRKIKKGRFIANGIHTKRKNLYVFSEEGGYVVDPGTYKLKPDATYISLFNQTVGTPAVSAPEAYHYSPENGGFETIVNDGKIYYVAYMMVWGSAVFDAAKNAAGLDSYRAAPILAPLTNSGNNPGTRAVFFDTEGHRFLIIKLWGELSVPNSTSDIFNPGKIDPEFQFVFLGEGKDGSTNAIFHKQLAGGGILPYLFRADFKSKEPVSIECRDISRLEDIKEAKTYAFGTRGDMMFYATDTKVYCYRYGRDRSVSVMSVGGGEKIMQMKIYVNEKDKNNNGKILFIATNNGNSGKVYKLKFNEMNGSVQGVPKEYSGFNGIRDMYYKN